MVTRASFTRFESRVFDFENQQLQGDTPEMNFLLQQLDRLDLAQKSLSVVGFTQARTTLLEEFIRTNFASEQGHVHIEHISKGSTHDRTLTGFSIIEFIVGHAVMQFRQELKRGSCN